MKFVAFGDSFTAGYSRSWTFDEAKNISFVNHLKTHTNAFSEYVNLAEVGASNSQIAYKVYDWVKNNDTSDCFIFISATLSANPDASDRYLSIKALVVSPYFL